MSATRWKAGRPDPLQVDFYQLPGDPAAVLARIAERVLDGGGRLLVVLDDADGLARLDAALWRQAPASFLAHGLAGQGGEADQPILLSRSIDPANGARHVVLADGLWRTEVLEFDRSFHLFDDASVADAREAWRSLGARQGVERRFWKQDEAGRWTQAA